MNILRYYFKSFIILCFLGLSFSFTKAQDLMIGYIVDEQGKGIKDAKIKIQDTYKETKTDANGRFSIRVKKENSMLFSASGYEKKNIKIVDIANFDKEQKFILEKKNSLSNKILSFLSNTQKSDKKDTTIDSNVIENEKQSNIQTDRLLKIKGTVFDENGETLIGVTISIKDTTKIVQTDLDGRFEIAVNPEDILIFSFVGMLQQQLRISEISDIDKEISITLFQDSQQLQEVQIVEIGYGQNLVKKKITGSITKIGASVIESRDEGQIIKSLQGTIAGVQVSNLSGAPDKSASIKIRGITSNGNNKPLFIIDGIIYDEGLDALNPDDIESIVVLKDASASIYGVRGGNGVILVTTKSGRKNTQTKYTFSSKLRLFAPTARLDVLNAFQYGIIRNEQLINSGSAPLYSLEQLNGLISVGTNWQDEIFRNAQGLENAFTFAGGGDKNTFSGGISTVNNQGIIDRSHFKRTNIRLKSTFDLSKKMKASFSLLYTHIKAQRIGENNIGGPIYDAINFDPTVSPFNENGNFTFSNSINQEVVNPLARISNTYDFGTVDKFSGNLGSSYEILEGLKATARFGFNFAPIRNKIFIPLAFYGPNHNQSNLTIDGQILNESSSRVIQEHVSFWNWNIEAFLQYDKTFNTHHTVSALLGLSTEESRGSSVSSIGFNIPNNDFEFADVSAALDQDKDGAAWRFKDRLASYFFRANYDFKEKYLLSVIIRRDGSSRFGPNNRFGFFPSFSLGWVLSDEAFFKNLSFVDLLKIRLSYGISGNDKNNGSFAFLSLLRTLADYTVNGVIQAGQTPRQVSNPLLAWEEISQQNIGLDGRLLKGKIEFTLDYYIKSTDGLILTPNVAGVLGTNAPVVNAGAIENKGFEFAVTWNKVLTPKINFSLHANISQIENKVIRVANSSGFLAGGNVGIPAIPVTRFQTGREAGYFYGYKTDGIFQTQEEVNQHRTGDNILQADAVPGDIRFVDFNQDGILNDADRMQIGSPYPDFTYGIGLKMKIYDFNLVINTYGSVNNDIYIGYLRNLSGANLPSKVLTRWTGPGSSNSQPRVTVSDTNNNSRPSDLFIEDGSFFRIQNIKISYKLPIKKLKFKGIDHMEIGLAVNNLFTFTRYSGFDPEIGSDSVFEQGIDRGFYPAPTTYTVQLKIGL